MERIARGLKKFVIDNKEPFIVQVNHSGSKHDYCKSMNEPLSVITSKHGFGIVDPKLVKVDYSETTKDSVGEQSTEQSLNTDTHHELVTSFLHKYYAGGYKGSGDTLESPLPTVTSWDHNSIVTASLIQMNNHCDGKDIKEPLPTITAGDGHFGEVRAFLIKYYGEGTGQDIKKPLDTVTSRDRFGLVTIEGVDYQIVDIGLRMLEPKELYGCQGFPDDYIIDRDITGKKYPRVEQVKRCGNAVPPPFAQALVKANLPELCTGERMKNMRIGMGENGQLKFA